jgi:RimJ/RimL family protein N-acetyltransferase
MSASEENERLRSDRERFRSHSVILNTVSWRLHEALGVIPEGADRFKGDILADLDEVCRLIRLGREVDKP